MKGNFSWRINLVDEPCGTRATPQHEQDGTAGHRTGALEKTKVSRHLQLRDIDLKIRRGDFVCVVGETGSGTSTLLQQFIGQLMFIPEREIELVGGVDTPITNQELLALKEAAIEATIPLNEAPVIVRGDLAYVGEDCWLQNITIRENILFGLEFDKQRYVKVCLACQLEQDFVQLALGDLTKIGDQGIELSGGQKARVSLARALYSQPEIVILDKIFCSIDKQTALDVFQEVVLQTLAGKTRLLATKNLEHIACSDKIVVMKEGRIHAFGEYHELLEQDEYFVQMLRDNERTRKQGTQGFARTRSVPSWLNKENQSTSISKPPLNILSSKLNLLQDLTTKTSSSRNLCLNGLQTDQDLNSSILENQYFITPSKRPEDDPSVKNKGQADNLLRVMQLSNGSEICLARQPSTRGGSFRIQRQNISSCQQLHKSEATVVLPMKASNSVQSRLSASELHEKNPRLSQEVARRGNSKSIRIPRSTAKFNTNLNVSKSGSFKYDHNWQLANLRRERLKQKCLRSSRSFHEDFQSMKSPLDFLGESDLATSIVFSPATTNSNGKKQFRRQTSLPGTAESSQPKLTQAEINAKIALWAGNRKHCVRDDTQNDTKSETSRSARTNFSNFVELHDKQVKESRITMATFTRLLAWIGGVKTVIVLVVFQFSLHYMEVYSTGMRGYWANIDEQEFFFDFTIATLKMLATFICAFALSLVVEVGLAHQTACSSSQVHDNVLYWIMRAPMNHYFEITPVSVILQTYQRDIETFNAGLLQSLQVVMKLVSWFIAISIFISAASFLAFLVLVTVAILIVWYALEYVSMNRTMNTLDLKSREPILTSLSDALSGRNVIQAYKVSKKFIDERLRLLDNTTVHFIVHQSAIAWFNIRVFLASKLITLFGVVFCIEMKGRMGNQALFMIIMYSMNLQWVNSLVTSFCLLEAQVQQVEILEKINDIPQESCCEGLGKQSLKDWPKVGCIEYRDVSASYHADQEHIIRGISVKINPGTFTAIVGPYGSGKSTLVKALVRLFEIQSGQILIDGINIAKVQMELLRSRITMISQEPELFQGTLRQNLDPFFEFEDRKLELAISKSGLAQLLFRGTQIYGTCKCWAEDDEDDDPSEDHFSEVYSCESEHPQEVPAQQQATAEEDNGENENICLLEFVIEERGQNLSSGIKQLICIIRALLRQSKVIIMDEPTSSVDGLTEKAIWRVMDEQFRSQGVTVLTIAHRVNSILHNEEVIVLEKGRIIESGPLEKLESDPNSALNKLLMQKEELEQLDREPECDDESATGTDLFAPSDNSSQKHSDQSSDYLSKFTPNKGVRN